MEIREEKKGTEKAAVSISGIRNFLGVREWTTSRTNGWSSLRSAGCWVLGARNRSGRMDVKWGGIYSVTSWLWPRSKNGRGSCEGSPSSIFRNRKISSPEFCHPWSQWEEFRNAKRIFAMFLYSWFFKPSFLGIILLFLPVPFSSICFNYSTVTQQYST